MNEEEEILEIIYVLPSFLCKLRFEVMCELQDSCQTEHCLLNISSEEKRVGL